MGAGLKVRFHEYNTHLEDETPITGHNIDNLNYSAESDAIYMESAGVYTYANVMQGDDNWDPAAEAAQATADPKAIDADAAYLVENSDGEFVALVKGSALTSYLGQYIRKANTRGGFGKRVKYSTDPTELGEVRGNEIRSTKVLRNGQLIIVRDGREYNAVGQIIQ